jgi:hypothetical protein
MATLISSGQKTQLENVFVNVHDTFSRQITIYTVKKEIFVATNQTYNALYSRIKDATGSTKTVTSATVNARVQYITKQYIEEEYALRAQTNLPISEGQLRLKLDEAGYTAFKFANRIEVDGTVWKIVTDASRIGLFSPKFYLLFLERAN